MEEIIPFNTPLKEDSIICITVLCNEVDFIDFFLNYYTKMGVTHFIFVDNNSNDGSQELLKKLSKNFNIRILFTQESYKENISGTKWVMNLLGNYKNKWVLVVDMDEFVILRDDKNLGDLKHYMQNSHKNVAQFILIDFYPLNDSKEGITSSGVDPFIHSKFYDKAIDKSEYINRQGLEGGRVIRGGVRYRMCDNIPLTKSHCINKRSFFKYDFGDSHKISGGCHFIIPHNFKGWDIKVGKEEHFFRYTNTQKTIIKHTPEIFAIAHFKFAKRDFISYVNTRIEKNQDYDNSKEYKNYLNLNINSFYDKNRTCEFTSNNEVYKNTIDLLY